MAVASPSSVHCKPPQPSLCSWSCLAHAEYSSECCSWHCCCCEHATASGPGKHSGMGEAPASALQRAAAHLEAAVAKQNDWSLSTGARTAHIAALAADALAALSAHDWGTFLRSRLP